jgi:SAM-dependent methyltransferase
MIQQARALNAHGERCAYHLNDRSDLALFPDATFDLVYSNIVLQHVPPRNALRYVGELVRVLRPGGLLVFQLPAGMRMPWRLLRPLIWLRTRVRSRGPRPIMEMHGVPPRRIHRTVAAAGSTIVRVEEDGAAGPMWRSLRYWITRP